MDPESKQLLKNTLELAEENNKLLHKIRGVQNREFVWKILKMVLIVGITLGSFYFLEPYLNKMMDLYSSVSGIQQNIKDVSDTNSSSLKDLLKKF
ncbi:MAG: hypothetical protein UR25_C0002G0017 [Candidatus Nomurabacteria bacterium GW2011_GWE1_32_28]|uniref:Uncharacterized protein n=1 Tax=Candidatus Nomurabacteria bacterium GW2011_GWF1_31_48 TaxID=1618767 RepID=A0A0F9YVJ6_9BACT|nr:MAG: hypothetical protein UR10_C0002G0017 [Candidatus Nomurabacteria bacterium GW2011_GWF2_30_133]KKP29094.1 MAG: hypothetical protein UR18_C0001G0215 [Candidatus Nomurabacteria bacterium GW2011_GWE2_31_40]KKP30496.1 MAG: hypothetical protein UR19_C0002G0017 [Candidatus Nomurabacteria bacterium GW2011_GWF1_31_48]KKP34981.1 MAG: hypothetical protein UR25_C0002G0017 [Candidatus Nomurabacteria bacterium GW2011_GWE1_32_28]HAS80651.1 hypothetical protein [Candidatus Nomurabacteria bacterium]